MGRLVHVYNQTSGEKFVETLSTSCCNEVFLTRKERFVISDDWVIKPASRSSTLSLLQRSGADGVEKGFEELEVIVSWAQVVSMLKSSRSSENMLSDTFLSKGTDIAVRINPDTRANKQELEHPSGEESASLPQLKLFFDKHKKKVMYAECRHDFVDLLVSLLAYPVNYAIKYMGGESCLSRNFRTLYNSAIDLDAAGFLAGSPCAKRMLLEPRFAPFMMRDPREGGDAGRKSDPEFLSDLFSDKHEFAVDRTYVVEDDLRIYQASAMSVPKHWCSQVKGSVQEMDVTMSRAEAVALVRAVVTSKTALTDVFKTRILYFIRYSLRP